MPDETSRRCLFVAIDRATCRVFMHIDADMTEKSSVGLLRCLKLASPIKISRIRTHNGSQFTDRSATIFRSVRSTQKRPFRPQGMAEEAPKIIRQTIYPLLNFALFAAAASIVGRVTVRDFIG